tara:strand:+ start:746 stop:1165 length:420 start_codon:yes stop_codon:yes gene_type:complete
MDLKQSSDETIHSLLNLGKQLYNSIIDKDETKFKEPYMIVKSNVYNIFIPGVDKKDIIVFLENNQIVVNAIYYSRILDNSESYESKSHESESHESDEQIVYRKYINIINNMEHEINYKNGILQIIVNNEGETKQFLRVI